MRRLPLSPHGANAVRVPRHEISKGAAGQCGVWRRHFPPDALPQRAVVATRRQQQRLTIRLVPVADANCQYENVRRKMLCLPWGMTQLRMEKACVTNSSCGSR